MAESLTPQQRTAVYDRGGSLLVSAAAGSGKTKVLVDRLLSYILDENDLQYSCGCSREKYSRILSTLNQKDLKSLVEENKPVETVCNFCNKKYVFEVEELKKYIK